MIGWVDGSSGASGDMLLAALVGAGVPVEVPTAAVDALGLPVTVAFAPHHEGLAGWRATVTAREVDPPTRTLTDVTSLLEAADLDDRVRELARSVFVGLARAEAHVHGVGADEVHFHEVGALDALADVVGCAAGFDHLGLDEVVVGPLALGGGHADSAHGRIPVPVPAVLELLRGTDLLGYGSAADDGELCTPTGVAVLRAVATSAGTMPPMTVSAVGVGFGQRSRADGPNAVRLVVGERPASAGDPEADPSGRVLLSTNVDDLDPRLWPGVLESLMAAGADDAWLVPILMKKGRPAHTLHVLAASTAVAALRDIVFTRTTTLGVREIPVDRSVLDREVQTVTTADGPVRVKVGRLAGRVVNVQPEYEDVAELAHLTGRPAADVLAEVRALLGGAAGAP